MHLAKTEFADADLGISDVNELALLELDLTELDLLELESNEGLQSVLVATGDL